MNFNLYLESKELDKNPGISLQEILGMLKGMRTLHHTAHWQSFGDNAYGNHLLFKKIYESLDDEIDTLGEKIVAYYGESYVDSIKLLNLSLDNLKKWNGSNLIEKSIKAEKDLQDKIKSVYNTLKSNDQLTLGIDDFLMSMANDHETNLYLLSQVKK